MQSPELAGGAGFTFEDSVGALYLSALLAEGYAPGIDNRIVVRVAFQQRGMGEPLDDVIVDFRSLSGDLARLSLQVKRPLTISQAPSNTDFREVVRDSWLTMGKPDFRRRVDRFGVAVGDVAKDRVRDLRTLCELARESVTTAEFQARFAPDGNTSQDVQNIRDVINALIDETKGAPCTVVELHEFLAHFVLIEFDFMHAGAVDPPQATTRVRECLVPEDAAKAPLVWSFLLKLARDSNGKAGGFDRARLVRTISEVAGLRGASSLRSDLQKLVTLARSYVNGIQDDIGGVTIDRIALTNKLDEAMKASRLIQIQGLPGSGKSVLIRKRVQRALEHGPVVFLKADQLEGRNWVGFAAAHGFSNAALQDLLVEVGATGTPVLFIDAIDRVEKEHQSVLLDVLRQIVACPLLDDWRIVVSLRDASIEMLRNWMADILDRLGVTSVPVGALSDDEAEVISKAKPELQSLLFGAPAIRDIVRRPFFAKILHQNFASHAGGPPFEPRSEVDLIENWWQRGGYNATGQDVIARQRALVELATSRSRNLSTPIGIRFLSTAAVSLLDQLIIDGIVQQVRLGHTVRFAHDIFFEWAFFHVLADRGDDWLEEVRVAGEPPAVARVVELIAQWEYTRGQNWGMSLTRTETSKMRSQWTRAWLLGPVAISGFSSDENQFKVVAFAEDFHFLKKALVWFQAEKTTPNPNYLASDLPQDRRQRAADFFGWPSDFRAWGRLIRFLLQHLSELPVRLYPDVLSVFEVWQNALASYSNPTSKAILSTCAQWLADLDAADEEREPGEHSHKWQDLPDQGEFRKTLSILILSATVSEPVLAEGYMRRLMVSEKILRDRFKDVIALSGTLARVHPALLVDLTLAYLLEELPEDRIEREREELRRSSEYRKQIVAKPEAERTRREQLMLDAPSHLLGVGSFSSHDWDSLCIDRDTLNFWPESPLREPFHSLFSASPDEALRLLRELCNHAMLAWRQLHRHGQRYPEPKRTPIPLRLCFPWGDQLFWGGEGEYQWFRSFSAPKPLGCGFMALEEWCVAELNSGRAIDELIQKVLQGNECIAVLGTAAMLALQTEARSTVVLPLITSQRLLDADHQRMKQDRTALTIHLMGFQGRSEQNHVDAIRVADSRSVRKKELAWLIPIYVFGGEQFAEKTRLALNSFIENLPFEYEEALDVPEERASLVSRANRYLELADTENYRVQKTEVPDQVAIVHVSPSASKPEEVAKYEEAKQYLKTSNLLAWASSYLEKGRPDDGTTLQSALAFAKTVDDAALYDNASDATDREIRRGAVAAVAALVLSYPSDCSDIDLKWARDVVDRALRTHEQRDGFWTPGAIVPWHHAIFAAQGLAADVRNGAGDESSVYGLIGLVAHPSEAISLAALREACGLWEQDPHIAWSAIGLIFALCHLTPRAPGSTRWPGELNNSPKHVRVALKAAFKAYDKRKWSVPALPPPAWVKVDGSDVRGRRYARSHNDYRDTDLIDATEVWVEPAEIWHSQHAAKILALIPVDRILASDARAPFLEFVSALMVWTNSKNSPPWVKRGRRDRVSSRLIEWTHALGNLFGRAAGSLSQEDVKSKILEPVFALEDEACCALLAPLCSAYVCKYIYDAPEVHESVIEVLDQCLTRLLAVREFRREAYGAGELSGFDLPALARTLMFISVEHASLAARYVNGDWSEISRVLPLIDRYVRAVGWAPDLMNSFLTLCERAKLSYPAEMFADQVLSVIGQGEQLRGWHGSLIPARIAGLIQYFADRDSPMASAVAQKFLRILDLLVDMGDRRSAALQLGEAFREVRVP